MLSASMFTPAIIIGLIILLGWVAAISYLIDAAKEKGYHQNNSLGLWLIGLIASPIVLGLYTASLPDRGMQQSPQRSADQVLRDEMPQI